MPRIGVAAWATVCMVGFGDTVKELVNRWQYSHIWPSRGHESGICLLGGQGRVIHNNQECQ